MTAPRIMLKIDAGTGVSDETLDQLKHNKAACNLSSDIRRLKETTF